MRAWRAGDLDLDPESCSGSTIADIKNSHTLTHTLTHAHNLTISHTSLKDQLAGTLKGRGQRLEVPTAAKNKPPKPSKPLQALLTHAHANSTPSPKPFSPPALGAVSPTVSLSSGSVVEMGVAAPWTFQHPEYRHRSTVPPLQTQALVMSRAEQSRAEQSRAEQSRAEQSRAEQCCPVQSIPVQSSPVQLQLQLQLQLQHLGPVIPYRL